MSSLYFEKHPTVIYNQIQMKNLLTRTKVLDEVFSNTTNFYPYIIEEGDRIDTVAYNYYGNSNLSWLVMLSNDFTDPYYDWYLTTNQFQRFIKNKYGSLSAAQEQIVEYRHTTDGYSVSPDTIQTTNPSTGLTYGGLSVDDFDAVTAYQQEEEMNEARKFIKLIDKILVPKIIDELRILLDE